MLTKLVYIPLSQDSTDGNEAAELLKVQAIFPRVTSLQNGLEYKYKSLKTLLGDSSINWSKNKIYWENYTRTQENKIAKQENLPLIQIGQSQPIRQSDISDGRHFESEVKVEVLTNAAENGSTELVGNIGQRIRGILEPQDRLGRMVHYCSHPYEYGFAEFLLFFQRIDPWKGNQLCLYYKARYTLI